ncbi:MAG TPA: hypothetical protein VHV32_19210 [Candidatus Angelobacter sp.]|nr:hypothetical protein [Candidatus Angelobacter sp.]
MVITQKTLAKEIKAREHADGRSDHFRVEERNATVIIEGTWIRATGPHRAWKYLYFLKFDGQPKEGGYDRRDSFVAWAINKLRLPEFANRSMAGAGLRDNNGRSVEEE